VGWNPLRRKLADGQQLLGTTVTLPSPMALEIVGLAGFDFVVVDMEHGPIQIEAVQTLLQALGNTDTAGLVRVPGHDPVVIKQVLDLGPCGLVVPHVHSPAVAREVVRASRYPPQGNRGVTAARAAKWGLTFEEYARTANEELLIIPLIEDASAVETIGEILRIPGLDVIYVGPWDLAASLGHLGDLSAPRVQDAIQRVVTESRAAKKPVAIYADDVTGGKEFLSQGYDVVVVNEDVGYLLGAARETVAALRDHRRAGRPGR